MFREFLKCEYSEENILFYAACEDLKNGMDEEKVEEKCRLIYDNYVSILSPREVRLSSLLLSLPFSCFLPSLDSR